MSDCSRDSLRHFGEEIEVEGFDAVGGGVIMGIAEKRGVGHKEGGEALVPKGGVVA